MEKKNVSAIAAAFAALLLISCTVEPEPLHYGKDPCQVCKMTLVDRKFGAEIVTKKGRIYKFDDVNCMLNFYNSDYVSTEEMQEILVVDYSKPEKLIDARNAFYVRSESIKTPMASNVASFLSNDDLSEMNKNWKGILMTWGELQTQFK